MIFDFMSIKDTLTINNISHGDPWYLDVFKQMIPVLAGAGAGLVGSWFALKKQFENEGRRQAAEQEESRVRQEAGFKHQLDVIRLQHEQELKKIELQYSKEFVNSVTMKKFDAYQNLWEIIGRSDVLMLKEGRTFSSIFASQKALYKFKADLIAFLSTNSFLLSNETANSVVKIVKFLQDTIVSMPDNPSDKIIEETGFKQHSMFSELCDEVQKNILRNLEALGATTELYPNLLKNPPRQ